MGGETEQVAHVKGQQVDQMVGAQPKWELKRHLEGVLA